MLINLRETMTETGQILDKINALIADNDLPETLPRLKELRGLMENLLCHVDMGRVYARTLYNICYDAIDAHRQEAGSTNS